MEEIKSNSKNIIFATLTFSEESLKKLEYNEKEPNKAAQKAISLFRKRWWKKHKAPLKHWLITELGHDNTKRIHLHGIIWTKLTEEQFEKEWGYGWIFFGHEVSEKIDSVINGRVYNFNGISVKSTPPMSYIRTLLPRFSSARYDDASAIARIIRVVADAPKRIARFGIIDYNSDSILSIVRA